MKNKLTSLLETLGYEVYEQGSFASTSEYDESFFTLWNIDTPALDYMDNVETGYVWEFAVNFYSVSPKLVLEVAQKTKELLAENKWIIAGKGRDARSDSKLHVGRELEVKYIEKAGGN